MKSFYNLASELEAIVIYHFFSKFPELENLIHRVFSEQIKEANQEVVKKIYFYYGAAGCYNNINYDETSVKCEHKKYKIDDTFNSFSTTNIIRIDEKEHNAERCFKEDVKSLQRTAEYFGFHDCCIKLIKMRNILAHQYNGKDPKFDDRSIIEKLSSELITKYNKYPEFKELDLTKMNDNSIAICSNEIYMEKIIEMLNT